MANLDVFIGQIREVLINTDDSKPKQELYHDFINECKLYDLTEQDFYQKVLKIAHKSIDWSYIEEQKKKKEKEKLEKEKKERAIEQELEEIKKQLSHAPNFIDRLIKTAFDDEVLEKSELISIFNRVEALGLNSYDIAEKISDLIDKNKFKAYPKANYELPSLQQTLCSTDWHSQGRYQKLTTPPPPPFPWIKVFVSIALILITGFTLFYFFYLKEKFEDKNSIPYYTYVNDLIMRTSPVQGVDHNILQKLSYGTEILVNPKDNVSSDWLFGKAHEKKGYVSKQFVLNKRDFIELNGIFGDTESKEVIATSRWRIALLEYFQDSTNHQIMGRIPPDLQMEIYGKTKNTEIWQVFARNKESKYNTVAFPRIVNPNSKHTDFACIIKNVNNNNRKFLLFTFSEEGIPSLYFESDAPREGYILSVRRVVRNGRPFPFVEYTN